MKMCKQCGLVEIVERRTFCRACGEERKRTQRHARRRKEALRVGAAMPTRRLPQRGYRTCLACGRVFLSEGYGNRRCWSCKQDPIYLSGHIRYRYWGPHDYLDPTTES